MISSAGVASGRGPAPSFSKEPFTGSSFIGGSFCATFPDGGAFQVAPPRFEFPPSLLAEPLPLLLLPLLGPLPLPRPRHDGGGYVERALGPGWVPTPKALGTRKTLKGHKTGVELVSLTTSCSPRNSSSDTSTQN